jgi:superfamily II DNA/RNA helicase
VIKAEGEACTNAILFCNRKTDVDILAKSLKTHGFDAAPIHGDLDQSQRMRTLDGFRDGSLRFLVASDVAARGLDIPAVSHVFNFDLPSHAEDYVHRIGRTGRAGRKGVAISISTPSDQKYLDAIEALVKKPIPRGEIPEGFELSEAAQRPARKDDDRPARGAPRSRSRDEKRDRPIKPHGHEASLAPLPAAEPIVVAATEAEAPARPRPPKREDRAERKPRHEDRGTESRGQENRGQPRTDARTEPREDRRSDRRDHNRSREDRDPPVVGMGDHVPDFLMRGLARVETPQGE